MYLIISFVQKFNIYDKSSYIPYMHTVQWIYSIHLKFKMYGLVFEVETRKASGGSGDINIIFVGTTMLNLQFQNVPYLWCMLATIRIPAPVECSVKPEKSSLLNLE